MEQCATISRAAGNDETIVPGSRYIWSDIGQPCRHRTEPPGSSGAGAKRLNTTQIFLHGHYHPDGAGIALSRDLASLGSGFTFVGEGGVTHQVARGDETTINLGVGVGYNLEFLSLPVGVSAFTAPSSTDDPPVIPTGGWHDTPSAAIHG